MTHEVHTVWSHGRKLELPDNTFIFRLDNFDNQLSPCAAYQDILSFSTADVIMYIHDDVTIHDSDWAERVMRQFDRPNVVAVGLGGALTLGRPDLYRRPYQISDMARGGYRSNQTDAEVHGDRFTGSCRVAVLDAYFMAVRRDWLLSIGGWPTKHLTHHCLDLWLACECAKGCKETRVVGVSVTHHGGGSSTKPTYREAKWLLGGSLETDHTIPHHWLYDSYRDTLPIQVNQ